MPVVITGADGFLARALIPLLVEAGAPVRAVLRKRADVEAVRALGATVAVCALSDTDTLAAVMDGAHTVCHLAGGLDLPDDGAYEEANAATTRWTLQAAAEARIARILFLSYPGASPTSGNAYLRTKGIAEEQIRASGLQHAIIRATHVYGRGSPWLEAVSKFARSPVAAVVIGPGTQRMAPTFVDDVARALAAADDREQEVAGTFGLEGPDRVTADHLVDVLAGRKRPKVHVGPGAAGRLARLTGRRPSRTLLEVLATDSLADAPDAASEFGLNLTPLREGLARSRPP